MVERAPDLLDEWDHALNGGPGDQVMAGSDIRAWWRCRTNPSHLWVTAVRHRVRGNGCPFRRRLASGEATSVVALPPGPRMAGARRQQDSRTWAWLRTPRALDCPLGEAQAGVDQADVGEGLRGVAQLLTARRLHLFSEQARIAAEADQAFEDRFCLLLATRHHQRLDKPEAADGEGAFVVALLSTEVGLGVARNRRALLSGRCERRHLFWAPALLAVPVCCGAPLFGVAGATAFAPLVRYGWMFLALAVLLGAGSLALGGRASPPWTEMRPGTAASERSDQACSA